MPGRDGAINLMSLMIVEDDEAVLQVSLNHLKRFAKEVIIARDGLEALELFKEKRPDIILADIEMPKLNGLDLLEQIKEIDPNIGSIILTAYDDREYLMRAISIGANEYLVKPVSNELLTDKMIKLAQNMKLRADYEKSVKFQKLLLDSTDEGIFGLDRDGNHTFVNPVAAKMLGYTQEELIGKHSHEVWHHTKKDGSPFLDNECPIYAVLKEGHKVKVEDDIFWRKDGSSFRASYISSPLISSSGEIIGAVGTFWDVTEKRQKDERLKLLSLAVEESSSSVAITDTTGAIEYVNKRFCEMNGYSIDELMGQNPRILRYEKNDNELYRNMWDAITGGKVWEREIQNKRKDDTLYWCRLSIFPLYNNEGSINKYVGICLDVTEQKSYESELKKMNEVLEARVAQEVAKNREKDTVLFEQAKLAAIGEMIRDIAHHWRQPLTAIGMLIHNIKDSYEFGELTKEEMDNMVDRSTEQLQQMSKTIDNFRSFFKPTDTKTNFDPNAIIAQSIYMIDAQIKAAFIDVVVLEAKDGLPKPYGYQNDYKQALLHVLKNSMEAIIAHHKKGRIEITLDYDDKTLYTKIRDNGGGIDESAKEKVFNPYFSTKGYAAGVGLGLYMSKIVIERNMDGKIYFNNIPDGVEFVIELPLISQNSNAGQQNITS